jgi:hypothetical protein
MSSLTARARGEGPLRIRFHLREQRDDPGGIGCLPRAEDLAGAGGVQLDPQQHLEECPDAPHLGSDQTSHHRRAALEFSAHLLPADRMQTDMRRGLPEKTDVAFDPSLGMISSGAASTMFLRFILPIQS